MAKFHVAWLKAPLPLFDEYRLATAGIENRALRNSQPRLRAAGVDLRVHIHVGKQDRIRIGQLDPKTGCPRVSADLRIDHADFADEFAARITSGAHHDRLTDRNGAEVTLRNVDHRPNDGRVRDAKQYVAGLRPHSLDRIALENDAVAWRRPFDGDWNGAALFHGDDGCVGNIEVHQPLPRSAPVSPAAASSPGIDRRDVFGGG